jgi:uncharacterized peroxidase-related enzyme
VARVEIPTTAELSLEARGILDALSHRVGFLPNLHRLMTLSPHALRGITSLQSSMAGTLDAETRTAIALAVSEVNACSYCLSRHCYTAGRINKTAKEEIALNREGRSGEAKRSAAARFAAKIVDLRGHIDDAEFNRVKAAGFTDSELVEIVVLSVQYLLTNYISNVFQIDLDFPTSESQSTMEPTEG